MTSRHYNVKSSR